MTIILDNYPLPEKGQVEIKVDRCFEIKITAAEARRQVGRWLQENVTMLIGAEPPSLVIDEQIVWRVPVVFSVPDWGQVGVVGAVAVDVQTGAMTIPPSFGREIEDRAEELAQRLPPYRPRDDVPAVYYPEHIPPAPTLMPDEEDLLAVPASPLQENG